MHIGPTSHACPNCTAQAACNVGLRQQITRLQATGARLQVQKTLQAQLSQTSPNSHKPPDPLNAYLHREQPSSPDQHTGNVP